MKIILFIGLIIPFFPIAQNMKDSILMIPPHTLPWENTITNTDSLEQQLKKMTGTERIINLCKLSYSLFVDKNDSEASKMLALEALELAEKTGYNNGIATACYMLAAYAMRVEEDTIKAIRQLQKAEKHFDEHIHWTLKYRIWSGIATKFKWLNNIDSAVYYYKKPLEYLDEDEAWLSHLGSYTWLSQNEKRKHDQSLLRHFLDKQLEITFNHPEYRLLESPTRLLSIIEYVSMDFAVLGDFDRAISICHRTLDSIARWETPEALWGMFTAKFLGRIARIYHHWGKYDFAIIYHDSAIVVFDNTLMEYKAQVVVDSIYPTVSEWDINMANQLEERAGVLIKTGDFSKAANDLQVSLQMRSMNNDELGVAGCFDKFGDLYQMQGKFGEALKSYDSALVIKKNVVYLINKKAGKLSAANWTKITKESIAETYLKLGHLYAERGLKAQALAYLVKSLETSRKIGSQKGEAEALCALGDLYLEVQKTDSAGIFYKKANEIYALMGNLPGLGLTSENRGNFYLALNDRSEAMSSYMEAQKLLEQSRMIRDLPRVIVKQADIYRSNNQHLQAKEKYEAALKIAEPLDLKKVLLKCYEGLSEIYALQHDTGNAFLYYKALTKIKDEIFTIETNRQITEIETQYETQKKEQKILLLEQENLLNKTKAMRNRAILLGLGGVSIMALLWTLLYLRQNKLRNDQEKNRLQQKLLRSQMNPHFIFNALSSVQNSIINDHPETASKYLTRFSKLMRNILVSSAMEAIPLEDELITIENYLALQKIRFDEKFDYFIKVDESLDPEQIQLPPMLLQPFIENSIEHGFRHKHTTGRLMIDFMLHDKLLTITIEDDGIGRQKSAEMYQKDKRDYKSLATEITRQRLKAINRGKKRKIALDINDLNNQGESAGTQVIITVPV
jgi:tetratricopeptide (TPR) repeat protein